MHEGTAAVTSDASKPATVVKHKRAVKKQKLVKRVMRWAERLNHRHARLGDVAVLSSAQFPWAAEVERDWPLIRAELHEVLRRQAELPAFQEVVGDATTVSRDRGWKSFFFMGYGHRFERNIRLCPDTWRALRKIPGLKTAMFSILEPGKHIPLHKDPYNGVLRYHLGLIVPEPRHEVAIVVDGQTCHWEEGRSLIFDDRFEHEAWNRTDGLRAVLFCDFVKPLRFPANLVNWAVIKLAPLTRSVREARARHAAWEDAFHGSRG